MSTFTLKRKFVAFGALAVATSLTMAGGSFYVASSLRSAFAQYADGMQAVQHETLADQGHDAIRGDVYVALAAGRAGDAAGLAAAAKDLNEHIEGMKKALAQNASAKLGAEANQALAKVAEELVPYFQTAQEIVAASVKDLPSAEAKLPAFLKRYAALEASMGATGELLEKMATEGMAANEKAASDANIMLGFVAACALAIQLLLCYLLGRNVLRQLGGEPAYASEVVRRIADGDLTVEVQTHAADKSSLLFAMKRMQQQLKRTVLGINESTVTIAAASTQIASGNADLSQRTEEQASSLEETASSMEELTGTVKQNAENARQANQLAAGASAVAVKGGEVVGQVVQTMSSINDSSKKIAEIIGVIDGIAFQTNILALNAAVEAARAGEQGRGFAVVASEVRTLAQRSAAAAKEIKALITDSVGKVDDGTKLVDEAGKTMAEIVSAVKRVTDIMAEIAAASQEQTSGIEQVNQAIVQMDQVTQQNAALVEEAAAAADSMREQAQNLTQAVAIFKLSGNETVHPEGDTVTRSKGRPEGGAAPHGTGERVERRGPNRAKNVARLPVKAAPEAKVEPVMAPEPQSKARKVANARSSDDNWQEF